MTENLEDKTRYSFTWIGWGGSIPSQRTTTPRKPPLSNWSN